MKGICFIPPLHGKTVKKIKIQTRRIVACPPNAYGGLQAHLKDGKVIRIVALDENERSEKKDGSEWLVKPKYKVGDILYLKEPYKITHSHNIWYVNYKFDEQKIELPFSWGHKGLEKLCIQQEKSKSGWLNKLFMPAWCARHYIKIIAVRAERLQDISNEDCFKEGIAPAISNNELFVNGFDYLLFLTPREAYKALINSIDGKDTWDNNPWVWVYDYELIDKPNQNK
ncbi:hypothetical protein [Dysgonomonas macrotermitis]|uniref:Uncharacterized protein n=1 Tax=Dysgonomonas macrotermitis TaxID=1346286 RepID=A0A1M5IYS8_9BACT|nr:hypothetical protein [Dysgonomonas macrotermitis]SHG32913.1 hypothetical protein SAMN05444362_12147 [Dysgonomonas macrotermitis]